jgi:hypothetical protein
MRGLLCEKAVSSFAKGGKVGGVEGKSWNMSSGEFILFFFALDFLVGYGDRVKQSCDHDTWNFCNKK